MNRLSHSPSYLSRNPYSYCFRIKIPKDLHSTFAKKELRYSLGTGYLSDAKTMARVMAGRIQQLFHALRKGDLALAELTPELVNDLVKQYHQETIEHFKKPINPFNDDKDSYDYYLSHKIKTQADLQIQIEAIEHFRDQAKFELATGKYDDVLEKAEALLIDGNVTFERNSELFLVLCRGLLQSDIKGYDYEIASLTGEPIGDHDTNSVEDITVSGTPNAETQFPTGTGSSSQLSSKLLSEVIPLFVDEMQVRWEPKTKNEVEASLALFVEFAGDVPIRSIDRAKVAEYKATLKKLPPNKNRIKRYRNKTTQQILEMKVSKTLSVERINKHLQRVGALFEFAINHGIYVGPNPATKMQLPKQRQASDKRAPFTNDELNRLFRSSEYLSDSFSKSYMFWTPIIALFHGMRQNEIAGLFLEDIKQEDGVWFFDLFSKKSKPDHARRVAPIHPFLIEELNFLDYVQRIKDAGNKQLFPECTKTRDGYAKKISRWFNGESKKAGGYKKKCGIVSTDGRMRDFHSFRTTFITRLRHKKVYLRSLKEVVGHSVQLDVTDDYTDPTPVKKLFDDVISKADFHDILDLTHVKNSKYVIKSR